jgi:hypothetical protein
MTLSGAACGLLSFLRQWWTFSPAEPIGESVENEYVVTLVKSLTKLVEQRRALAKRDASSDRNEGYAERIVSIQAAIDATERAISQEQALESKAAQAA